MEEARSEVVAADHVEVVVHLGADVAATPREVEVATREGMTRGLPPPLSRLEK